MDELPVGWTWSPLGQVAAVQLGKMLDRAKNVGELRPYLRNINVRWFDFDLGDLAQIRMSVSEVEKFTIQDGDVLVCEGGEPGRCAVWLRGATDLTYQKALHRVRVSDALDPSLLTRQLRLDALTGALADHLSGSTIKHLPQAALKRYPVRLPPPKEQQRITDKLDSLLARVDACRDRLARVAPLLKRFRQSVLAAATSGRLTDDWQHPQKTNWIRVRADEVCAKVQSGGTPKAGFAAGSGIPFLKVYNIVDQRIAFEYRPQFITTEVHERELAKSRAFPGDVLMNIVGPPLGKVAVLTEASNEWNINQAITLFRPSESISSSWLYILLCEGAAVRSILDRTKGSVGQVNISLSQCRAFEFPVPSTAEQAEIVRRVESLFAYADRLESRLANARTAVDRLTPALLAKAFRGELVPQDPNDEPARALLERLQAARPQQAIAKRRAVSSKET